MKTHTLATLVLALALNSALASTPHLDAFDLQAFAGHWYEVSRSKNVRLERGSSTEIDIKLQAENTFHIHHVDKSVNGTITGSSTARQVSLEDPALFKTHLNNNFFTRLVSFNLRVLETDYDSYAAVVSVKRIAYLYPVSFCWILSRTPTLDAKRVKELHALFEKSGYCTLADMRGATSSEL